MHTIVLCVQRSWRLSQHTHLLHPLLFQALCTLQIFFLAAWFAELWASLVFELIFLSVLFFRKRQFAVTKILPGSGKGGTLAKHRPSVGMAVQHFEQDWHIAKEIIPAYKYTQAYKFVMKPAWCSPDCAWSGHKWVRPVLQCCALLAQNTV